MSTKGCRASSERSGDPWVIDYPVKIEGDVKALGDDIADRRADRNVKVSVGHGAFSFNFSLYLLGIYHAGVYPDLKVIFEYFLPPLDFERYFYTSFCVSKIKAKVSACLFRHLCIGEIEADVTLGIVFQYDVQPVFGKHIDPDQWCESLGEHDLVEYKYRDVLPKLVYKACLWQILYPIEQFQSCLVKQRVGEIAHIIRGGISMGNVDAGEIFLQSGDLAEALVIQTPVWKWDLWERIERNGIWIPSSIGRQEGKCQYVLAIERIFASGVLRVEAALDDASILLKIREQW